MPLGAQVHPVSLGTLEGKGMSSEDVRSIASLEARWRDCHAAMCLARELLIEALGDFICGSGTGPSPQMIWAFEEASFLEAVARDELEAYRAFLKEN